MKKLLLSFLFCFTAVNAFAITADEVLDKAIKNNYLQRLSECNAYSADYEVSSDLDTERILYYKLVFSDFKTRMDVTVSDKGIKENFSVILTEKESYLSSTYEENGGSIVFKDYQVLKSTKDIEVLNAFEYFYKDIKGAAAVFNESEMKKNKNEYIIDYANKDREKIVDDYLRKSSSGKKNSKEEDKKFQEVISYHRYWINKKDFTINKFIVDNGKDIFVRKEEIEKGVKLTDEERQQVMDRFSFFLNFTIEYKDYKKVPAAGSLFPYKILFYIDNIVPVNVEYSIKTFKVLSKAEADGSLFTPSNIKKGKVKAPDRIKIVSDKTLKKAAFKRIGLLSSGNSDRAENSRNKEEVEREVKEEVTQEAKKQAAKQGVNILKGLAGF